MFIKNQLNCFLSCIIITFCCLFLSSDTIFAQECEEVRVPQAMFQEGYIQVVGLSANGQSRYDAFTAAKVVAQKELLEVLEGVTITGNTTIQKGNNQSQVIRASTSGFLRGAIKVGQKYYPDEGYGEVCLRLYIRGRGSAYEILLPKFKDEGIIKTSVQKYKPQLFKPGKDGLIIDLRGKNFRPALINQIVTNRGKLIYDPSNIAPSVLAERGCGGYSNDIRKAVVILKEWGVKEPIIIKAEGVKNKTNALISSQDAETVLVENNKNNFLAQAKVVFVLQSGF
jgi:hypothetical protein